MVLEILKGVSRGSHEVSGALCVVSGSSLGASVRSRGYKGVSGSFREIQGASGGFRGVQLVSEVFQGY